MLTHAPLHIIPFRLHQNHRKEQLAQISIGRNKTILIEKNVSEAKRAGSERSEESEAESKRGFSRWGKSTAVFRNNIVCFAQKLFLLQLLQTKPYLPVIQLHHLGADAISRLHHVRYVFDKAFLKLRNMYHAVFSPAQIHDRAKL